MRVGELSRRTGVGVSTLRAWERRFGLLDPERSASGHRLYTDADVETVAAVRRLLAEGLTLSAAVARIRSAGAAALPSGENESLLLRQIVQAANEGIWVARDGRTRYANRRMADLLGCSLDELLARSTYDFIDPELMAVTKERVHAGRTGSRQRYEVELRRADGSTFMAEMSTSPLQSRAGRYEGAVAVVSDVSARKEAEHQARLHAALLDAVEEAVAAATPDGTITYVNPAAERLMGWRATELIGKSGLELFPAPGAATQVAEGIARLQDGTRQSGEMKLVRRDGTSFVAHISSAPVLDESGNVVGVVGMFRDMTARRRLDAELRTRDLQAETVAVLGARVLGVGPDGQDAVLIEIVDAVRRVLDAERASIFDVPAGGSQLTVRCASPPMAAPAAVPAGSHSLPGYTVLARKVVLIEDVRRERRFDLGSTDAASSCGSAIAAPVFGPVGVRAVLTAESSMPNTFDRAAVHFMQGMANVVGAAL